VRLALAEYGVEPALIEERPIKLRHAFLLLIRQTPLGVRLRSSQRIALCHGGVLRVSIDSGLSPIRSGRQMRPRLDQTAIGGFAFEWMRALSQEASGGALLGECVAAANAVRDGDFRSWTKIWGDLAERMCAQDSAAAQAATA
jgi:hypothetical protein